MNTDQLRYFITAAQLENLSRAAEVLYVNQPALSKSIGKLEAELGTPLFDRNGKKLTLNPQGERFMDCATLVLRELELAEADLRRMGSGSGGHIRIGAAGCADAILRCAGEYRRLHPDCDLELDFDIEEKEVSDLSDYDVLIHPEGVRYGKFESHPLGAESYLLAVPAEHPLAAFPMVSLRQLHELDYVFVRKNRLSSEYAQRMVTALNIPCRSVCYTDTRQSQLQIIASGMAVGLIPAGEAPGVNDPAVRLLPVDSRRFSRPMMICFKRDKRLTEAAREFRDLTAELLGISLDLKK